MLHILWMLLKIIGIIILAVLGLVVLTLGVVFFVPVKYRAFGRLDKEIEKSSADMKFSWLLHLISGKVNFLEKQLTYELRILGKKIQFDEDDDTAEELIKDVVEDTLEDTVEDTVENTVDNAEKRFEKEIIEDVEDDLTIEDVSEDAKEPRKKKKKRKKKPKDSLLKKIKYTFQNICDKIKVLKQKKDEVSAFLKTESHKSAFKKIWKEIGKLLKALKPKKLTVNAHFGFEDPSLTGKVLTVLSMLYPFYGDNISVQPDFENIILEGDFYIKGKIRLIHAVKLAWNLVWDKNVRITIKDTRKWFN